MFVGIGGPDEAGIHAVRRVRKEEGKGMERRLTVR
jgi:hypothetical protein